MPTPVSLTAIAERGRVQIEHDAARGAPDGAGYAISVTLGKRLLIGTCVGSLQELAEQIGGVAGDVIHARAGQGVYLSTLTPLEVLGLRGEIVSRIERQDWSA